MQHVTAFSPPQTVPAAPAVARKPNLWILDGWRDLILYVCTPLVILPIFVLAQTRWSAEDIYLFVAAFGAMGHHLPGMIRAYGDRALFQRFKYRFIFAPIFLVVVCTAFFLWDLKGIVLVAFIWGVWHGMMQTYGFCRIYDAKVGSFAALTRRLDFALCGIWFATAVLLSSQRMTDTLESYYSAGGPFIPPGLLRGAQQGLFGLALTVAGIFLANFIWMWIRGKRPSPVKLVLLITSISFWWYCNNIVASVLVGIALFEVFHDVQYLSLVWIYNRKRVETDSSIGGFMRFVFRRSGSLIGLYVGLIFAYGALGYFKSSVGIDVVKRILTGVVTASALLHFYYDGFIWKVREKSTRQSLGIGGGTADVSTKGFFPSWALHGAKWAAVFVIPLGALWYREVHIPGNQLERLAMIVADLPNSPRAHINYANALQDAGHADQAAEEFSTGLHFNPDSAKTHVSLATILMAKETSRRRRPISMKLSGSTPTTPSTTPVMSTYWNNSGALRKRRRSAKPLCVWCQSPPRPIIAMAPSWKNMRGWKRQLRSIGRLCRLTLVLSMPISISRVRFSQRASYRKQRRITWRRPGSTRSSPSLITIWERFL